MDIKHCKNCALYQQHYTLDKRYIFRVYCGHCTFHKPKKKLPDANACEHFSAADPDESAFARKEYLSKELLQYLLHLELLPEIKNAEDTNIHKTR